MRKSYGPIRFGINWLTINRRLPKFFPDWAKLTPNYEFSPRVLTPDGRVRAVVEGAMLPFVDHIEMGGYKASHIVSYKIDENREAEVFIHSAYPCFRMKPNVTEASYSHNFTYGTDLFVDGKKLVEKTRFIDILGKLSFINEGEGLDIKREFFPAVYTTAIIEKIIVENPTEMAVDVEIKTLGGEYVSVPSVAEDGREYLSRVDFADEDGKMMSGLSPFVSQKVEPSSNVVFYAVYYTRPKGEDILVDVRYEEKKRNSFVSERLNGLRIETPNPVFDAAFSHAVIRGSESIFETKGGLMHCPGGGSYYAAIWTNDNVEYAAPFFGYAGYDTANNAMLNGIRMFGEEIDRSGIPYKRKKSIPSSIFAEGDGKWGIAGDRGDCAMYGSGAARFALSIGDKRMAEEIFRYVEFCVEYTKSRTDHKGRVKSDADELEGRFPHGKYNLSTNCLAYDMYLHAGYLAGELGRADLKYEYLNHAAALRDSIVRNFSGTIEGYHTFKYFDGNKVLRSWICLPMCFGIYENSKDTADALFGEKLYEDATLKTASNRNVVWDRSLLFAIRGAFKAGIRERSLNALTEYTLSRFLGNHAPYPYEAYPEGNRRHLSAESLLYCRIFTEGILGLQVLGFGKIAITPSLPKGWTFFRVRHLVIAEMPIDIVIENDEITVFDQMGKVISKKPFINGQKASFDLNL